MTQKYWNLNASSTHQTFKLLAIKIKKFPNSLIEFKLLLDKIKMFLPFQSKSFLLSLNNLWKFSMWFVCCGCVSLDLKRKLNYHLSKFNQLKDIFVLRTFLLFAVRLKPRVITFLHQKTSSSGRVSNLQEVVRSCPLMTSFPAPPARWELN